ncbi:jg4757, partial [Pararge aegeria aegeria]
ITDSPLCRACMETEETPIQCNGVAEQRAAHLGSSATLHEALGDLGGLLSFWSELGWLERSSGEPHQWPHVQRTVPDQPSAEKAQEQKKKKKKKHVCLTILNKVLKSVRSPPMCTLRAWWTTA